MILEQIFYKEGDDKTMGQSLNYPIQMVSAFSTQGEIKPLRFRYEDPEHQIITVDVGKVIARKEMTIGKGGSLIYTCESEIDDTKRMYELRYEIGTHKWVFSGRLN